MKKFYFASFCLLVPLLLILYPWVFLGGLRVYSQVLTGISIYIWIGIAVLLIDLWRSDLPVASKVLWTFLNLFLGLVFLPIYWFRFIWKRRS